MGKLVVVIDRNAVDVSTDDIDLDIPLVTPKSYTLRVRNDKPLEELIILHKNHTILDKNYTPIHIIFAEKLIKDSDSNEEPESKQ